MTEYTTSEASRSLTLVITLNGSIATPFNISIVGIDGTAIGKPLIFLNDLIY